MAAVAGSPKRAAVDWRTCRVAGTIAQQFARALAYLGRVPDYLNGDQLTFRVCEADSVDCNGTAQPFPGACERQFTLAGVPKSVRAVWSPRGIPAELSKPYVLVFIKIRDGEVQAEWPLQYQFRGSPGGASAGPVVLSGITQSSENAPTIRTVAPTEVSSTTRDSVILFGERALDPP